MTKRDGEVESALPNMRSSAVFGMVIWTDACTSSDDGCKIIQFYYWPNEANMVANGSKKMNFELNYKPNEIAIKLRTDSE